MDITCGDCGARFRLDVALLQGAKGARFRCRRCGGKIVAQSPEARTVLSADDVVPIYAGVPSVEPEPVPSPQPEAAWPRTDTGQKEMHGPGNGDPVPPEMPGAVYSRLEVQIADPPGKDAGPDRTPPPPEEYPAGGNPAEETAVPEPGRKAPSRRASSMSTLPIISVLCVLLLAPGALYFGTTKPGRERLGKIFPGWAVPPGSVAETPYDIRNVKWSIEKETASGTLFVVKGEVANFGIGPSGGIGIRATLLGKDNQALAEKTAFAGNILDEASMRRMDRPAIEGAMSNRFGEGNANKEIPPGKALPFMVLFFDPPVEIEAVMVKAIDAR